MEEAGSEHGLERANEDARRIWLNKMITRNRISRYKLYTYKIINSKYLLQYPNYLLRPCRVKKCTPAELHFARSESNLLTLGFRVTQATSADGKRDRARDIRDNLEDHIYEEIAPGHKQTDDD